MTTLLRKDWESISSRTNFSSSSPSSSDRQQQQLMVAYAESSAGPFDRIPFDIFMQILKIRKFVVSDNCLWINFLQNQHESWDSIFYAESHLRLGYPLQWIGLLQVWLEQICVSIWEVCYIFDTESAKASRRQLKENIYSVLFDMNVPTVCAINQLCMQQDKLQELLLTLVSSRFLLFQNRYYVAFDYEAELSKDTQASFEVAAEGWFTLSKEGFKQERFYFSHALQECMSQPLHTLLLCTACG